MKGKTINGYTLERLLGIGGMAEVWYAENRIGKKAAVKVLLPQLCADESVKARFVTEAQVMVELNHPNIRQVFDLGDIDGRPAIVMEYLDGADLKAKLKRGQRFGDDQLKLWWNQMVDALNYTHKKGVVHRDIKPSNIFIDNKGNVKLLDFGIAKVADVSSGTMTGSTLGTRIYMSPEQVKDPKRVGTKSDVYSLAVSFVHLITGKAPYDSTTSSDFDIQVSIVSKPIDLSPLPKEWSDFLAPYLAKEPDDRPELRHFETVTSPTPAPVSEPMEDDEGTVVETHASRHEEGQPATPVDPQPSTVDKESEKGAESRPKGKNGLWTLIGVIAAVVALALFFTRRNSGEKDSTDYNYSSQTTPVDPNSSPNELYFEVDGVYFTMKKVDGGTFTMGNKYYGATEREKPEHDVNISTFYIGETEVTQGLWKAVMHSNPSYFQVDEFSDSPDRLPVEQVSYEDCKEFIKKLNAKTGKQFRLPTEAEWEYAARGGKKKSQYTYVGGYSIENVSWYKGNSSGTTHVVRSKMPNALGLYDMGGNVWEWCSDWYGDYEGYTQANPIGPDKGTHRVIRGGGWNNDEDLNRPTYRGRYEPQGRHNSNGLRLALTL